MTGPPLDQLPKAPRTAWLALRDALRRILGDDLVAVWAHGGTTAVDEGPHPGDLDTYVILARQPRHAEAQAIDEAQDAIAVNLGVEWDSWFVRADAARLPAPPAHAWQEGRHDTSWAIHRAHWLAGRYATLHGPDPAAIVPEPTWEELEGELRRELEHIERHVAEGDTDPYEATYALLNGSRILHAVETGNVVISKLAAADWALRRLPEDWRPALESARRTYLGEPYAADAARLEEAMPGFVAYVREHLPDPDRPPDARPRWSGYLDT